jgi:hypothetical protein
MRTTGPFQNQEAGASLQYVPAPGIFIKKPFCQPFVNFTIGRMALYSGHKTLQVKAKRLASTWLCRQRCPVSERFISTRNDLQEHGRHRKSLQGSLRHRYCAPRCVPQLDRRPRPWRALLLADSFSWGAGCNGSARTQSRATLQRIATFVSMK